MAALVAPAQILVPPASPYGSMVVYVYVLRVTGLNSAELLGFLLDLSVHRVLVINLSFGDLLLRDELLPSISLSQLTEPTRVTHLLAVLHRLEDVGSE